MNTMIKIDEEFVKILQDNFFNGIDGGGVIEHTTKVLEILEWIKILNVDKDQLRLYVFPILLSGHAKEWWDNEVKGTITTWKELVEKFFQKYYPLSYTCNSKILDDLDNRTNYLEVLDCIEGSISNTDECDEPYKKSLRKTYSDLLFKPYLDAQEGNEIYNFEESNQYSPPIPVPIEYNINNPDEVRKSEEFKVI
ncbi:reverse transcriptase domain-containing protein [Tanacetum coccineum]